MLIVFLVAIIGCNNFKSNTETILTGEITILVDETVYPVIEDQKLVFENQYDAKIKLISKSEREIVKLLSEGKNDLAILTRELTAGESNFFVNKKIKAKVTPLAKDGIAFISDKSNGGMQIDLKDVVSFMKGNTTKFSGLVFDNANSSTVRYMMNLASVADLPKEKIFSFKTNNEVVEFVSKKQRNDWNWWVLTGFCNLCLIFNL